MDLSDIYAIVDTIVKTHESFDGPGEDSIHPQLDVSPSVGVALSTYIEQSGGYADPGLLGRVARATRSLGHYASDSLSGRAFDAAALHPLADQIHQPNQRLRNRAAGLGLREYFTAGDPRRQANAYVGTLLGDLLPIDEGANIYEQLCMQYGKLGVLNGADRITEDDWINFRVGANVPEIARISRITNIESQLARAAYTIDRVANPGDDDQELFRNIHRIETFYAPNLEILGFHAFDMEAQSRASCARVERSGNNTVLDYARNTLERARNVSPEVVMGHYFGNQPKEHLFKTPEESLYGEHISFSSTSLDVLTDGRQTGELNARFKTVGKYALKLLRNPSYSLEGGEENLPADVFGMLAVLPDNKQLGAFFADSIKRAIISYSIEMVTSASKKRPAFIQGSPDFVAQVCKQIPEYILNRYVQVKIIDDRPEAEMYQVAKFTSNLHVDGQALPVEMQLQTKADRVNARLGVPSHMNHNAGDGVASITPGRPGDLRDIFMRKHDIDKNGTIVNPLSIAHGEEFYRDYGRAVWRDAR